jgi:hypothetical protein
MVDYPRLIKQACAAGVSDAEFRALLCAVQEYEEQGQEPALPPALKLAFRLFVAPITARGAEISAARRRAAHKRWQQARERKAAAENPPPRSGEPMQAMQSMQTPDLHRLHDCAADLHEEYSTTTKYSTTTQFKDKKSSSSTESHEQRDSGREQEPEEIMREAERVGVRLTAGEARQIRGMGLPTEWLRSPLSYLAYVSEFLHKKYPKGKTAADFHKLFLSALCKFGEFKHGDVEAAYPVWLEAKLGAERRERAEKERREQERAVDDAKREAYKQQTAPDFEALCETVEIPADLRAALKQQRLQGVESGGVA